MDLQKLFEIQEGLDNLITKEHPVKEGEDRLAKKILALQVELGELANEWRGFKYWSYNQKPKTEELGECPLCKGTGDLGTVWAENCIVCRGTGKVVVKKPLLEEFADGLHFLLSIGLDITEPEMINLKRWNLIKADTINEQFLLVMSDVIELYNGLCNDGFSEFDYEFLLLRFIHLGEMLGFTWEQIEQAYMEKNRINYERQLNHY